MGHFHGRETSGCLPKTQALTLFVGSFLPQLTGLAQQVRKISQGELHLGSLPAACRVQVLALGSRVHGSGFSV